MKLIFVFLFSLFFIFPNAFGQKRDTLIASKIKPSLFWHYTGIRPTNNVWVPRYDRLMIDIKYNDLVNPAAIHIFNNRWNSIGFNTQFVFDIPMNTRNTAGFGIGIGYQFSKFVHNTSVQPITGRNYDFVDSVYFDRSILRTHAFFIPVEFRFRTKGLQHFKFHIGTNIGYRYGNNKIYQGDTRTRTRTGKMGNFQWLYLDVHARLGIRNVAIIVSADMFPIFSKTTTKTIPISLGVTLSLF